jgi:tRNA nucleotidyltransferase (CCA-adding enzyme)
VTLEEDLARRDLTINSIAVHAQIQRGWANLTPQDCAPGVAWEAKRLVDPYGGQRDLQARCCAM